MSSSSISTIAVTWLPVIGTPQGLAVYQNGVRINEVFGDVVNWDLIPQSAINRLTLVPSNPVYGLNATGGALAFEMKNGYTYHAIEGKLTVDHTDGPLRPCRPAARSGICPAT